MLCENSSKCINRIEAAILVTSYAMSHHLVEHTTLRSMHACTADESLQEPLLGDEVDDAAAGSGRPEESYAIVPHSINKYDWEALIAAFANACKAGWSGVLSKTSKPRIAKLLQCYLLSGAECGMQQ